jgi:hypothetical protein
MDDIKVIQRDIFANHDLVIWRIFCGFFHFAIVKYCEGVGRNDESGLCI